MKTNKLIVALLVVASLSALEKLLLSLLPEVTVNWILTVSGICAVLLAAVRAIQELWAGRVPFTRREFFERIIAGLPRANRRRQGVGGCEPYSDIEIIRLLLRYVFVSHYRPDAAVNLLQLPPADAFQAWFTAIALIQGPLEKFRDEINDALTLIEETQDKPTAEG